MREALNNAVVHGNHEDVRKCVSVTCLCELGDVSMTVRDEGRGFECAGINRHGVGDERALRVRTSDPLGPEFCASPTAR
jgi:anti-sigma regulatory factor (Ser/Thr protein kinase)